jgi:hypothetical protein
MLSGSRLAGARFSFGVVRNAVRGAVAIALAAAALLVGCAPASSASAGSGYLGLHLPAGFDAFAADSPWRTAIEASPALDPNSATMIAALEMALGAAPFLTVSVTEYTAPIHVIDSTKSRKVTVTSSPGSMPLSLDPDGDGVATGIPIPREVWADPQEDAHVVIVDPDLRTAWEFWHFARSGAGYTAGMAGLWDLDGPGYNDDLRVQYWWRNGATAARTPYIGGLIRYEEAAAGDIRHALNVIVPAVVVRQGEFHWPVASSTDGTGGGAFTIPEGARIQLNPAFDLDGLYGIPPRPLNDAARSIARVLQVYGAYVVDRGAGFGLKAQNLGSDGGDWASLPAPNLSLIPLSEFRVLQGTTVMMP